MRLLFVLLAIAALICTIEAVPSDPLSRSAPAKRAAPPKKVAKPTPKPFKKTTLPPVVIDEDDEARVLDTSDGE